MSMKKLTLDERIDLTMKLINDLNLIKDGKEDIAQELYLRTLNQKAYQHCPRYSEVYFKKFLLEQYIKIDAEYTQEEEICQLVDSEEIFDYISVTEDYEKKLLRYYLDALMDGKLTERQRFVVKSYFNNELSILELSGILKISRGHTDEICRKAINMLRCPATIRGLHSFIYE